MAASSTTAGAALLLLALSGIATAANPQPAAGHSASVLSFSPTAMLAVPSTSHSLISRAHPPGGVNVAPSFRLQPTDNPENPCWHDPRGRPSCMFGVIPKAKPSKTTIVKGPPVTHTFKPTPFPPRPKLPPVQTVTLTVIPGPTVTVTELPPPATRTEEATWTETATWTENISWTETEEMMSAAAAAAAPATATAPALKKRGGELPPEACANPENGSWRSDCECICDTACRCEAKKEKPPPKIPAAPSPLPTEGNQEGKPADSASWTESATWTERITWHEVVRPTFPSPPHPTPPPPAAPVVTQTTFKTITLPAPAETDKPAPGKGQCPCERACAHAPDASACQSSCTADLAAFAQAMCKDYAPACIEGDAGACAAACPRRPASSIAGGDACEIGCRLAADGEQCSASCARDLGEFEAAICRERAGACLEDASGRECKRVCGAGMRKRTVGPEGGPGRKLGGNTKEETQVQKRGKGVK